MLKAPSLQMPLLGFYEIHYRPLKQMGRSYLTSDLYLEAIRMFEEFLGHRASLRDLDDATMSRWCQKRLEQGKSPATVNKHLRHLLALWRFASSYPIRLEMPRVRPAAEFRRDPRAWTLEEMRRLIDSASREPGRVGDMNAGIFWKSLVLTLYDTGARKSVVLNLSPRHVDLSGCTILLPADLQKQKRDQTVTIDPHTAVLLRSGWNPQRRWAFPWPHDRYPRSTWTCLNRHFRKIVERAEVPMDTRDLFHRIRKTHASYAELVRPGSATHSLGHASPRVTQRHYLDPRIVGKDERIELPRP